MLMQLYDDACTKYSAYQACGETIANFNSDPLQRRMFEVPVFRRTVRQSRLTSTPHLDNTIILPSATLVLRLYSP